MESAHYTGREITKRVTFVDSVLSSVRVYPNPWRSDRHPDPLVTFTGISLGTTIKLFTVSGHLVKTLRSDGPTAVWTLTNADGRNVSSGLYLYLITSAQSGKVTGKLEIIR